MSNKLIIIHGVDVTDCKYLHTSVFNEEAALCDIALQVGQDCINTPNCYYKQLKRKEEECENYCFTCDVAERMRKVTYAATGGRLSYANYTVEAIEQAYQDQLNHQVEQKTKELTEELKRKEQECEMLKNIINEAKKSKLDLKSFLVGEAIQNEYEQQLDQLKKENEQLKKSVRSNKDKRKRAIERYLKLKEFTNKEFQELKAEQEIVNDFLLDTASCIAYDGNSPANLDEVYICIEDICEANYNLDKKAKLYRQALQEIKEFVENEMEQDVNTRIILQKCEVINDNYYN